MTDLLKDVPSAWGPKLHTDAGAVSLTRTGPNHIVLRPPAHLVLLLFTPQPDRLLRLNSARQTVGFAPAGSLEIIPADSDFMARWKVAKENLLVALDPASLSELAGTEFQRTDFEIHVPRLGTVDEQARVLAGLLKAELQQEAAANPLCIDALLTLFGTHLLRRHSSLGRPAHPRAVGGLSARNWRRVRDYIDAHLGNRLTVAQLAAQAGLSPSHFLRAFRQTTGLPPHQYVLSLRLAKARQLVLDARQPLDGVARACGFSSHSHLTAAMRRAWGVTPSALRSRRGHPPQAAAASWLSAP